MEIRYTIHLSLDMRKAREIKKGCNSHERKVLRLIFGV